MRQSQKSHIELRETYLQGLVEAIVLNKKPHLGQKENSETLFCLTQDQVQCLIKREHRRRMYRTIENILKFSHLNNGGITRIDIPAAQSLEPYPEGPDPKTWEVPWGSITDQATIVKHICAANVRQYHQAYPTPFGSGDLANSIGPLAGTSSATSILSGILPALPHTPLKETKDILTHLATPPNLVSQDIKNEITPDQFIATYKKVQE
jgi:hypothetical protein